MDIDGKIETARIGGAVSLVTIYGFTLEQWVAVLTIVYLVTQIVIMAPKVPDAIRGIAEKAEEFARWAKGRGRA